MSVNLSEALKIFRPVIGIEVHAQLNTVTKMWCSCEINKNAFENHTVCEICSAQPGSLPVLNKKAVELAAKTILAHEGKVNLFSAFDRKNYFYPDLPKGYQITQFFKSIGSDGKMLISINENENKVIRISKFQLEEDTGKSLHKENYSLINLNRCGVPLLEIITAPDMNSAFEAVTYVKALHANLIYSNVCLGNLQDGNFRMDVNVSLQKINETDFGTRVEIKNLNSFKNVEKAIEFEIERQANLLLKDEKVLQQTLLFNMESGKTHAIRTKSDADDYRYFPEPDLIPLLVTKDEVAKWQNELPELPSKKADRFMISYGLSHYDAQILCSQRELANYFEEAVKIYPAGSKKMANWIISELLHYLNESNKLITNSPITASNLVGLVKAIDEGIVSGKMAKEIFIEMYDKSCSADLIIQQKDLRQNNDSNAIEKIIVDLVLKHPKEVEELKSGRDRVMGFFVGQVMKQTGGKANPAVTTELIKKHCGV